MSLEIFDFILCLFVTCMKKNWRGHHSSSHCSTVSGWWHLACFNGLNQNFSHHKWGETMQNSNPFKDGMFQKTRIKHPMNYDEAIDSWKMVKIPRLQVGNKKIWYIKHVCIRQYAWNWLPMIEDVGHLGQKQHEGSRLGSCRPMLRKSWVQS